MLEALQRRHRVLHGDDLEPAVRHVRERDEAVDPRGARGEDSARPRRDRDRVPRVLALAGGREDDQRVGRRPVVELDQGRSRRSASEQGAHDLPGEQRVEGALARHGRPRPGDGEPDRAVSGVAVERERHDDPDRASRGSRQREREEGRCQEARHGWSLSDARG